MGFALFGSSSDSKSYITTTTNTYDNAFNTSLSSARTYENVGNPVLNIGLPGQASGTEQTFTLIFAGLLLLGGVIGLTRSG